MPLTRAARLFYLSETTPYYYRKVIFRKVGIHPLNRERQIYGELHHLYYKLRKFPDRFFSYVRMSIESFDRLLKKTEQALEKTVTNFQINSYITPAERLVITLRDLITGSTFRHLAVAFRVGERTVSEIVCTTCQIIWEELVQEFMPVPTKHQLQKITSDFYERWNFPNCFGAIDGKHCQVKCPNKSGSLYFNYLKYFSVGLQAVADADKKFVTIEVGSRGSESDGGVFRSSTLYNLLESDQFNVPPEQALPNSQLVLPNYLIGDEAYPLKTYLMRPYPRPRQGVLSQEKQAFNEMLSKARKCIENAFGILYQKFGIFGRSIEVSPKKAIIIIKAACVLHNYIRHFDGNSDLEFCTVVEQEHSRGNKNVRNLCRRNNRATSESVQIRNILTEYLNNNHNNDN